MSHFIFTDGACKGNPGPASIGAVCFEIDKLSQAPSLEAFVSGEISPVFQISDMVTKPGEKKTNNQAEYISLIKALQAAREKNLTECFVHMDSKLVIEQMKGNYKVKNERMKPLFIEATEASKYLKVHYNHVGRDSNQIADYLANLAFENRN